MKTLANCAPREFLRQTNRIRKAAAKWLDDTKLMALRKDLPQEPDAAEAEFRRRLDAALDAMLEARPEETAELLGLMCFIEPEDLDAHPMSELFEALAALLECREVIDFFISLARLGSRNISDTARA